MVGSAFVRNLAMRGFENLVFSPYPPNNLTDQQIVADFFKKQKPDYVILAAAKVGGILSNNTYRAQFIYENLMIQNNIIHQSYLNGVKKLLFLGSSCVYPKNCPQPIKEEYLLTSELEYTNEPYAVAKIAGIKMCEAYNIQYGTNFISVMPTNLFGPNDNYNLETSHVLPALIRKMHLSKCLEYNNTSLIRKDLNKYPVAGLSEKSSDDQIIGKLSEYGIGLLNKEAGITGLNKVALKLWGTGAPYREFLHVDDMVDACIFLMENVNIDDIIKLHTGKPGTTRYSALEYKNRHINIGSGRDQTIAELAMLVKDIVGFSGALQWDSSKPDGTLKKQLDVSILNRLGWKEKIGLSEGIVNVYENYLTGNQ